MDHCHGAGSAVTGIFVGGILNGLFDDLSMTNACHFFCTASCEAKLTTIQSHQFV